MSEILFMIVLIVAISLKWIEKERFIYSMIIQVVFFFIYVYLTGVLNHFAHAKKKEEAKLKELLISGKNDV